MIEISSLLVKMFDAGKQIGNKSKLGRGEGQVGSGGLPDLHGVWQDQEWLVGLHGGIV